METSPFSSYSSLGNWDTWPEKAMEEMNVMLLVYLNWPSLSLCLHHSYPPEYLPLNCQTWLGGVYYWENQPSRGTVRPSSKSALPQILPAEALPIVNTGNFSFSWGSNCPGLSRQCHFLWLWTHWKTQFQSQGRRERERKRAGWGTWQMELPHGDFCPSLSF